MWLLCVLAAVFRLSVFPVTPFAFAYIIFNLLFFFLVYFFCARPFVDLFESYLFGVPLGVFFSMPLISGRGSVLFSCFFVSMLRSPCWLTFVLLSSLSFSCPFLSSSVWLGGISSGWFFGGCLWGCLGVCLWLWHQWRWRRGASILSRVRSILYLSFRSLCCCLWVL